MTALFIDGHPATADDLAHQALVNYGAYTSFAVTDGGVRGLDRHLARLREAAVELFGQAVSEDQARAWMRQALGDRLAAAFPVEESDDLLLVTSGGQMIRTPVDQIRIVGRASQGVTVFRTAEGEKVVSVERLADAGGDEDEPAGEEEA